MNPCELRAMRIVSFLGLGLVLGACGGGSESSPQPAAPTGESTANAATSAAPSASAAPAASSAAPAASSSSSSTAPKLGAEGATCGGIAAIQCNAGLKCVMTGQMHPDKSGTCQKP